MLQIDHFSSSPIYEQIVEQMEKQIALKIYKPGDMLPSVRALSVELRVNPNTLQKAYAELERRNLCLSVPGSGRYITQYAETMLCQRAMQRLDEFKLFAGELYRAGLSEETLLEAVREAARKEKESV